MKGSITCIHCTAPPGFRDRRISTWARQHRIAPFGREKSWKSQLSMALRKFLFSECKISIFECRISTLSMEFPFLESRILGGLMRTPLQFWAQNLHYLSIEFIFSKCRILGDLFRAVYECKFCFFLECRILFFFSVEFAFSEHKFEFSERGISIFGAQNFHFWRIRSFVEGVGVVFKDSPLREGPLYFITKNILF